MTCQCGHAGGAHGYAIATVQFCALCACKAFRPLDGGRRHTRPTASKNPAPEYRGGGA